MAHGNPTRAQPRAAAPTSRTGFGYRFFRWISDGEYEVELFYERDTFVLTRTSARRPISGGCPPFTGSEPTPVPIGPRRASRTGGCPGAGRECRSRREKKDGGDSPSGKACATAPYDAAAKKFVHDGLRKIKTRIGCPAPGCHSQDRALEPKPGGRGVLTHIVDKSTRCGPPADLFDPVVPGQQATTPGKPLVSNRSRKTATPTELAT